MTNLDLLAKGIEVMANENAYRNKKAILAQRARRHAASSIRIEDREVLTHVALFDLGGQSVGLPVRYVREIQAVPPLTSLPGLPPVLCGVVQVRGELLAALDLGRLLGLDVESTKECLAIVEGRRGLMGFLTTSKIGFRTIYQDEVTEGIATDDRPFTLKITKDLTTILDVPGILESDKVVARGVEVQRHGRL